MQKAAQQVEERPEHCNGKKKKKKIPLIPEDKFNILLFET